MGKENFECSSSWVQRFRARHNIVARKVCGEADGVPEGVIEEWFSHKWPALCEGYTPEELFNADETGLFYNLTPDKRLKFKGEEYKGRKLSKTRITVLVAANMSGSCKRKLLIQKSIVLDAILMISEAWEKVTHTTIANCFLHAGFKDLSPSQAEYDDDIPLAKMIRSPTDEDDNIPLAQLVAQLQKSSATEPREIYWNR
ncbi:Tigger transposable element-derived protein 4 [Eumeta japonica]|uniref:Tigger transposable element-derived protein 4 n=1 Tax=Eumeta variegata TaxID=151549 RepID=A0A4C1UBT1_EUMVA|nr:Tigger transposable element-derived protein 4 [Eumeta japonica]